MNLRHLTVFYAVAKSGGINRAATQLGISQPAVSREVHALESALGMTLLERHSRGVRLTETGRILADYAQRLFTIEAQAEKVLSDLRSLHTGIIKLGGSMSLGNYFLPEVITAFHQKFPDIEVALEVNNTDAILDAIRTGRAEIGFVEGAVNEKEFQTNVFMHDELIVVASPAHPLNTGKPVAFSTLRKYDFIMREPGSGTRSVLVDWLERTGQQQPDFKLELGSPEAVKRAVQSGIELSMLSTLTVINELDKGTLVHIPLTDSSICRPLYRVTLWHKQLAPATRQFLSLVDEHTTAAPYLRRSKRLRPTNHAGGTKSRRKR